MHNNEFRSELLEDKMTGIVRELLKAQGYRLVKAEGVSRRGLFGDFQIRPDILAFSRDGDKTIVETKLYRMGRTSPDLLEKALRQTRHYKEVFEARRAILVVSSTLSVVEREAVKAWPASVDVWDPVDLIQHARTDAPGLVGEIIDFTKQARIGFSSPQVPEARKPLMDEVAPPPPPAPEGQALAAKLEASSQGKSNKAAQCFEDLCEQALRLLFKSDFATWAVQRSMQGGFHRTDLIARIASDASDFWLGLAQDFNTRYVIFEFKNYRAKIGQGEVYTTEKYLFSTALRTVAVIIARNGSSPSADLAMKGALREQAKLILCINLEELCRILRGFDVGEDPSNLLIEKLDDMLMTIVR